MNGDYCHSCGQRLIKKRFSTKSILVDLGSSITNVEAGFSRSFLDYLLRPGVMIHKYLNGATRYYMKPFRYTFIWATIATIVMIYSGVYDLQQESVADFMNSSGVDGISDPDELQNSINLKVQEYSKKFMSFLMLVAIPFNSFGSWIVYKRSTFKYQNELVKYHYADHLIINTYITGTVAAIGILATVFYAICPQYVIWGTVSGLLIGQIFTFYVFLKVFKKNWFKTILKTILAFLLALILAVILLGGLSIVGGIIWAIFNH
ncbi:MAG: DUF3667 domain-containing protein [Flavobacteriales bacterium]